MQSTNSGRAIACARRGMRFVVALGLTGFVAQQAACPIVAALAAYAPTPQMLAAAEASGFEGCAPCASAGASDCVQQLLDWLDAQVRGDPSVPFPDDDCMGDNTAI